MDGVSLSGGYAGEGASGQPEGEGTFVSVTDQGVAFTYTGGGHGGLMEGEGTLRYDAQGRYTRSGAFTAGGWTPTWLQALSALGTCEPCFSLTEEQIDFLSAHPELWEEDDHQNFLNTRYKKEIDRSLNIRRCFTDASAMDVPNWMSINSLRTIRSYVAELDGEHAMTCITAADGTYSYPVRVIFPDRLDGLRRGQRFHVVALPLCLSEYTTVLGTKQSCLVLVAADAYFGLN